MGDMVLAQQSRSFNGYVKHLGAHVSRMVRTAQEDGYTEAQLRELCLRRANMLRSKADEIERLIT
jgi:hypothetical protein